MSQIKLIIKGFVIGLGKIIPGVSGSILAMLLGVYEDSIDAIAHFFSNWKKNIIFLSMLALGAMLSIVLMSHVIKDALHHYYLPTMLLFVGLMLGGFSSIKKEVEGTNYKKYLIHLIVPFLLIVFLESTQSETIFMYDGSIKSMGLLFLFGAIDAITMIVPGISGTAILMLLGCYTMLLETFSQLLDINQFISAIPILLPFVLGILVGAIMTIKIVSYLLEKHSISFHYTIISFFLSSVFLLLLQTLKQNYSVATILIGLFCFFIGYMISKLFDNHYNS